MRGGKSMKYTYDHIIKFLKLKLPGVPIPMYTPIKKEDKWWDKIPHGPSMGE
jgi:hypothetical protein